MSIAHLVCNFSLGPVREKEVRGDFREGIEQKDIVTRTPAIRRVCGDSCEDKNNINSMH